MHGQSFFTPLSTLSFFTPTTLVFFSRVVVLTGFSGLSQVRGLNVHTLPGVSLGAFFSTIRAHHSDHLPQYGIDELCWVQGINARTKGGYYRRVCIHSLILHGDSPPRSSPIPVLLDL